MAQAIRSDMTKPTLEDTSKISDKADDVKGDFDALKADLGALTGELKRFLAAQNASFGQKAVETAGVVRDASEQQLAALRDMAQNAAGSAETLARKHPVGTVAGAALLGFAIGALATRR